MTIAVGARSAIGIVAETVWGTTPTTPALLEVPFTQFSVNKSLAKFMDQSIQGDRMYRPSVTGNTTIAGDLDVAYQGLNYDKLLESVFNNAINATVIKIGNTRKSFTFEHSQIDTANYFQYTGMVVDKFALKLATSGIVTGKFSLIGKDHPTVTIASIDTVSGVSPNGFYTPAVVSIPFVHNGGTFKEGGVAFGAFMSLDVTFDNKSSSNFALGSNVVRDFSSNFFEVTGTASVYFEDATLYNKFINSTTTSIEFSLTNGTSTHDYLIPNVRYHGATKTISGNGPIVLTVPFVGFYDSTTSTNAQITIT